MNDWLLKINDVDLANKDRKQVIKAVLGVEGVINMVVRRRRSLGTRVITPVQLSLVGHKGPLTPFCVSSFRYVGSVYSLYHRENKLLLLLLLPISIVLYVWIILYVNCYDTLEV